VPDYFAASLLESAIIIDNHSDEKKRIFSESSPFGQAELEMEVQTEVV
jgi:hypothetical protein